MAGYIPNLTDGLPQQTTVQNAVQDESGYNESLVKHLLKVLVEARVPLPLTNLVQIASDRDQGKYSNKNLLTLLNMYPDNFSKTHDSSKDDLVIKPTTSLGLCQEHWSKNEPCKGFPICKGLHICKYFLLSDMCEYGGKCVYGHDLFSTHNIRLLRTHLLEDLNDNQLKFLLRQSVHGTGIAIPKICKHYNAKAGCRHSSDKSSCHFMHICKHYVLENCRFESNCNKNHDIFEEDVKKILVKHGFDVNRTEKEILADLRDAKVDAGDDDTNSMESEEGLQSEQGYNRSSNKQSLSPQGRYGSTPDISGQMSEMGLSIPQYASDGSSDDSDQSSASSQEPSKRIRAEDLEEKRTKTLSAGAGLQSEMPVDAEPQQICLYHLRRSCAFDESCKNVHKDMPYQWQYTHPGTTNWEDIDKESNIELECNYCDPSNDTYNSQIGETGVWEVNLNEMIARNNRGATMKMQRLSTVSHSDAERQPLATMWQWYWQNKKKNWKLYGELNVTGYTAAVTSGEIEQKYLVNPEGQMQFATEGHQYLLDFARMVQRNIKSNTERKVHRRPQFIKEEEVEKKKTEKVPSGLQTAGGSAGAGSITGANPIVPRTWVISREQDLADHCQIVQVSKKYPATRNEYKEIESLFYNSMNNTASITDIERIENGELWMNYVGKRDKMKRKLNDPNKEVNERRLFHGTPGQFKDAICKQGFDFRLSGKSSGTRYGKGSYFATTAQYSDCYTSQDSEKVIFIVKVLVGEFIKGKKSLVRPPPKDKSNPCSELYDSCVDDPNNPKIFVIFDFYQVYPEYMIRYELKAPRV